MIVWATAALLLGAIHLLWFPEPGNPDFFAARHPLILGTILLTVATLILITTIKRWVTILPGILGYAVLGGFLAITTGHLSSRVQIPRSQAVFLTVLFIANTILSSPFVNRTLSVFDRISLIVFVFCLAISMETNTHVSLFIAPSVGSSFLLLAWAVDHILRRMDEEAAYRRLHPPTASGAARQW